MSLDNIKFRRPVKPGDQIRFELEVLQIARQHVPRCAASATVEGDVVARRRWRR